MNRDRGTPYFSTAFVSDAQSDRTGMPERTGEPSPPIAYGSIGESQAARLHAVGEAPNPLLEAARALLRALADMPDELGAEAVEKLHLLLKQEMHLFQRLCEKLNIRREHMIGARYCLATALDECAAKTAWGRRETGVEWLRKGLATEFHEDRQGGDKVYLLIGRLMSEPHEHFDLLEVIYRILSLGFMGRYRHEADGARKHDAIRQRLYNVLQTQQGVVPNMLSPSVQSDARGQRMSFHQVPVWITFFVFGFVLLGVFVWFKYKLLEHGGNVEAQIVEIGRMTPPPRQSLHLEELLKREIVDGMLSVDEDAHHSALTFHGDTMFPPGAATVHASMDPLISKVASELSKLPGKITIAGYTDNVPIRSRQFASNDALSEARAIQVMQLLQSAGIPGARLEAIGRGEENPIGDNANAQGRAKNRRVEITVTR